MTSSLSVAAALVLFVVAVVANVPELDASSFKTTVLLSKDVWFVEFASKMCGSCAEFAPEVDAVLTKAKAIKFGIVFVEDDAGRELAEKYGVLETGLPGAGLFATTDGAFAPVVNGSFMPRDELLYRLKLARDAGKWPKDLATGSYTKVPPAASVTNTGHASEDL